MMEPGNSDIQASMTFADNLEPYQRLVELQKQMIQLAQQNERARQECAELRERLAGEIIRRTGTPAKLRQKVNQVFSRTTGKTAAKSQLVSLGFKQPSPC
jgi:regulator of replication initiation timing